LHGLAQKPKWSENINMSKSKGQVSIFLIFIFHILFLFFAMVINIGMLVHHKINLQNSVDLAAYYGAMKQSEILGAIAHSNYQIRQSWKLMNFRYHMLGGIGYDASPAKPGNQGPDLASGEASVFCMADDTLFNTRPGKPPSDQTLCKYTTETMKIAGMKVPEFVGAIALHQQVADQIKIARDHADHDFVDGGVRNFRLLTFFVVLFRTDVKNRKLIIKQLAEQLSARDDDFKDLEGGSVFAGVKKTFYNNLTVDNSDPTNTDIQYYNSMGHDKCRTNLGPNFPPIWLRQITVLPQYIYYDAKMDTIEGHEDERYKGGFALLSVLPTLILEAVTNPIEYEFLKNMQQLAHPLQVEEHNLYDVAGVEKNPWCMTYTGVSAISKPSLPFMPSAIKIPLRATAFAKAFGGKIGPWYESQWSRGDDRSKGGRKIDEMLPMRFEDKSALKSGTAKDYKARMPNYSRYPGDKSGIISLQAKKAMGEAILKFKAAVGIYDTTAWLDKANKLLPPKSNPAFDLPFMPEDLDILADVKTLNGDSIKGGAAMREFEILAVAPDLFDITYYSIEPNHAALYLRNQLQGALADFLPRGDLGSSRASPFTIIDQMLNVGKSNLDVNFSESGYYQTVTKAGGENPNDPIWGRLLTNWSEKSLLDYDISQVKSAGMFGHCKEPIPAPLQAENPTQGECLTGGRTGYSVKLVSKKFLTRDNLELGGFGTSGSLWNPPPDNFGF
jgi:hypothetical protein